MIRHEDLLFGLRIRTSGLEPMKALNQPVKVSNVRRVVFPPTEANASATAAADFFACVLFKSGFAQTPLELLG